MSQSPRRTFQWLTMTAVLAAGGGGAYHFTSGSGSWFSTLNRGRGPESALVADDTPKPTAQGLDALASAWGKSTTEQPAATSQPAQRAKNQYSSVRRAAAVQAADDDRYAMPAAAPAALPALNKPPVTRGQEPRSAAGAGKDTLDEALFGDDVADDPTSDRARDAFRGGQAAADDRYAAPKSLATPRDGAALDIRAAGNPFAAPPAAARKQAPLTDSRPRGFAAELPNELPAEIATRGNSLRTPAAPYPEPTSIRQIPDRRVERQPQSLASLPTSVPATRSEFSLPGNSSELTVGTGRPGERSLEGPQKPALVIEKFAPPEIQVGRPAKFKIQVSNVGSQTADDVVIRDAVPQGTELVGTSPRAETTGGQLVWRLGALSTGEQRTVEIELMPTEEGEIGSVANVSYSARASVRTRSTMPQLAIRMTAPSTVMIGNEQRVKIEIRNPGTGDATGVMLFQNIPDQVRHPAGQSLEFEIGTLRSGETRELELVLLAEKAGRVVNALQARADGNLQVEQQLEFEVIAPELLLGVAGPERRYLERPATYQISVENPGTAPAHDVEIVSKLPKGMRFVRANNMGEYDASTHAVYWSLAELPEGERGTVELTALAVEPGEQALEVQGKARQGLTDTTRQDVLIEGLAAIMFEVRDTQDPIEIGRETAYEIRVVNQGTKAASNVQVVVSLPPGMQAVSASGDTRHAIKPGGVVFEPLSQIAPKADATYQVQVKGTQAGDQRVTVQVNTDDISQPIRREESTHVFGDE